MRERGDGGDQLLRNLLAGDEEMHRLDARRQRGVDEILTLAREQPGLLPVLALAQFADELQRARCRAR